MVFLRDILSKGDVDTLESFLEQRDGVNGLYEYRKRNIPKDTPLNMAIDPDISWKIKNYLITHKNIDINKETEYGTPLLLSIIREDHETRDLLYSLGAEANISENNRLFHAIINSQTVKDKDVASHSIKEMIERLIKERPECKKFINKKLGHRQITALDKLLETISDLDLIKFFISNGATIDKNTSLFHALTKYNIEIVQYILSEHDVNLEARNSNGETHVSFLCKNLKTLGALNTSVYGDVLLNTLNDIAYLVYTKSEYATFILEALELVISKGADPLYCNKNCLGAYMKRAGFNVEEIILNQGYEEDSYAEESIDRISAQKFSIFIINEIIDKLNDVFYGNNNNDGKIKKIDISSDGIDNLSKDLILKIKILGDLCSPDYGKKAIETLFTKCMIYAFYMSFDKVINKNKLEADDKRKKDAEITTINCLKYWIISSNGEIFKQLQKNSPNSFSENNLSARDNTLQILCIKKIVQEVISEIIKEEDFLKFLEALSKDLVDDPHFSHLFEISHNLNAMNSYHDLISSHLEKKLETLGELTQSSIEALSEKAIEHSKK